MGQFSVLKGKENHSFTRGGEPPEQDTAYQGNGMCEGKGNIREKNEEWCFYY